MHKIKNVSFFFRILFQVIFILLPIIEILGWLHAPTPLGLPEYGLYLKVIPEFANYIKLPTPLATDTKILGFLISLIPLAIAEMVLYFLIRLFRAYERAEIFSLNNVHYYRNIGYTLLIGQLINPLYQLLLTAALSWHGKPRFISVTVDQTNVGIVLTAFLIILISWIMAEGYKLREEQQYTV